MQEEKKTEEVVVEKAKTPRKRRVGGGRRTGSKNRSSYDIFKENLDKLEKEKGLTFVMVDNENGRIILKSILQMVSEWSAKKAKKSWLSRFWPTSEQK